MTPQAKKERLVNRYNSSSVYTHLAKKEVVRRENLGLGVRDFGGELDRGRADFVELVTSNRDNSSLRIILSKTQDFQA